MQIIIKLFHFLFFFMCLSLPFSEAEARQKEPSSTSQPEKLTKNAIYLELLGNGIVYSLNYERALSRGHRLRAGGMYLGFKTMGSNPTRISMTAVPVLFNKLIGKRKSQLELGAGLLYYSFTAESEEDEDTDHPALILEGKGIGITTTIGYRLSPSNNSIFRIGLQPRYLFGSTTVDRLGFAPGISFGQAF